MGVNKMTDRFENLKELEPEFELLVTELIPTIADDYRAFEDFDPEDDVPSMQLTVATDDLASCWSFQTGDNSFTGNAYGLPHWAVVYLTRDSDPNDVAKEIADQLEDCLAYVEDFK
jgi:hypothetical protein